jgi:hypothetical protein
MVVANFRPAEGLTEVPQNGPRPIPPLLRLFYQVEIRNAQLLNHNFRTRLGTPMAMTLRVRSKSAARFR